MKENNICKPLVDFFKNDQKKLFKYNIEKNRIFVDKSIKENAQSHEILFSELQNIISKLNELKCNYSVDEQGDITLNCSDNDPNCSIKCKI